MIYFDKEVKSDLFLLLVARIVKQASSQQEVSLDEQKKKHSSFHQLVVWIVSHTSSLTFNCKVTNI